MIGRYPNSLKLVLFISMLFGIGSIAGCSVTPVMLDKDELADQLMKDRAAAREDVEPLSGTLELDEAVARAIKYNLDYRVKMMEQAIALGQLDLSRYDMLPQVLADAGYSTRNKPLIRSQSTTPDPESEREPRVNSDLSSWDFSLGLSWNLLDFGSSYYLAQQNANNLLAANEQRRRAMHLLIMEVESAYWKAASAQALEQQVQATSAAIEDAIDIVRMEQARNVNSPLESLRNLRDLLDAQRTIHDVQDELITAKLELANLINAPAGEALTLADIDASHPLPDVMQRSLEELELIALQNNAELSAQVYESRNAVIETRRAILDLLPGISFDWGPKYTTDSFVINDQWTEGALSVTGNLLNLLRVGDVQKLSQSKEELASMRQIALQMAIITQVHIARMELENTRQRLQNSKRLSSVDNEIELIMVRGADAGINSESEVVSAHTSAIVSELRKYKALAEFYTAESRLKASLGLEPDFDSVHSASIQELSEDYRESQQQWDSGELLSAMTDDDQASTLKN